MTPPSHNQSLCTGFYPAKDFEMSQTILLAGGTGFVGSRLQTLLREKGYTVRVLSRNPKGDEQFAWDPEAGTIDSAALQGVQAVINLAGAGIADGRWTPERKRLIVDSRTQSAALLRDAIRRSEVLPDVYISASAIGYYGNSGERLMHESDPPATGGFLSETCRGSEAAADTVCHSNWASVRSNSGSVWCWARRAAHCAKSPGRCISDWAPTSLTGGPGTPGSTATTSAAPSSPPLKTRGMAGVYNAVAPQPERIKPLVKLVAKALRRPAVFCPYPLLPCAFCSVKWPTPSFSPTSFRRKNCCKPVLNFNTPNSTAPCAQFSGPER